ncbi:DUF6241 domain-containing protein [Rossellomorea aquimaris]|uniref:DUF6241 domain-containing protein n=1 Tax=Rossellomorea aquimaris TaxID=189382 RepID=UPI001CD207CF|nr:DUF6241 domain-containing protein [Rossellomorea aquimaris]MCA1060782.1 DUF6241 domain-containing protein [Rossellomorea aquimaris]
MLRKKSFSIIVGSVVLLTIVGIYIAVGSLNSAESRVDTNQSDEISTAGVETTLASQGSKENPFGEKVKTPLSEELIRQYIHAMSHQKVRAKEKWSFFQITDERIDFLLNQLKINQYEDENEYKAILIRWKEGDFSRVVEDHNTIWKMQDGNIGKATAPLNAKQEEKYIESQKRENR